MPPQIVLGEKILNLLFKIHGSREARQSKNSDGYYVDYLVYSTHSLQETNAFNSKLLKNSMVEIHIFTIYLSIHECCGNRLILENDRIMNCGYLMLLFSWFSQFHCGPERNRVA